MATKPQTIEVGVVPGNENEIQQLRQRARTIVRPGRLLIGNKWVPAASGRTFVTYNPATKEKLADIVDGQAEDVDAAVRAARTTFESKTWRSWTPRDRGKLLLKIADAVSQHADELALLESLDTGKPYLAARNMDLPFAIDTFTYYAGCPDKYLGETIPVSGPFLNYTIRQAVGVVGVIIPWNFPLLLAAWKIAPSIATGCTVVLKPAEQTPLTALRLGEILLEAGVPEGVLNIVTGFGPTAGAPIASHMDIDKVAFTGSTEVGKLIMEAAAKSNLKRVSLELGGKSPQVVFADADFDAAVEGCGAGIFLNQGEICHAGSRVFLQRTIYDKFVDAFGTLSRKKKVGDPLSPETELGAIVSGEQYDRVLGYMRSGKEEGAKVVCGGDKASVGGCDGWFVQPTVFTDVDPKMKIAREEIFGPVVSIIPFEDTDDLESIIRQANATSYGLAAGIWTRDMKKAHYVAQELRAGTVWINAYNAFDVGSSWGGFKQSGIGRELGMHALELYTELKSIWVQL